MVPLTNKLKDKDKFLLRSLFKTKSTFTVSSRFCCCKICLIFFLFRFMFYAGVIKMLVVCGRVQTYVNLSLILTSSRLPNKAFKFSYIFFLKNLLQTANKMKFNCVQLDQLKKIKRTKSRLKRNIKML